MRTKYLYKLFSSIVILFIMLLVNCSCKEDTVIMNPVKAINMTDQRWQKLAEKKIFFGHQSVGYCIINGIEKKLIINKIDYKLIESKDNTSFILPGLYHSRVGENGSPKSKIDEFVALMDGGLADKINIAGFKLCYADIKVKSDLEEIYDYYILKMNYLSTKYPNVAFIHFTVPLFVKPKGLKGMLKIILYDHNIKRNHYNQYIINHYKNDLVFDLAKAESTYPDGRNNIYAKNRLALINDFTTDGGHPNDYASEIIAEQFLIFLSDIP